MHDERLRGPAPTGAAAPPMPPSLGSGSGVGLAGLAFAFARERARSAEIRTGGPVSGAARTKPIVPNRLPEAIMTIRTASGWRPSVGPVGDRLDDLLEDSGDQQHDQRHHGRGLRPLCPECDQHREDPVGPGPDVGDVGTQES